MEDTYYDELINEHGMTACEVSDEFLNDMRSALTPAIDTAKEAMGNEALYNALVDALAQ